MFGITKDLWDNLPYAPYKDVFITWENSWYNSLLVFMIYFVLLVIGFSLVHSKDVALLTVGLMISALKLCFAAVTFARIFDDRSRTVAVSDLFPDRDQNLSDQSALKEPFLTEWRLELAYNSKVNSIIKTKLVSFFGTYFRKRSFAAINGLALLVEIIVVFSYYRDGLLFGAIK